MIRMDDEDRKALDTELDDLEEEHYMLTMFGRRASRAEIAHAYAVAEHGSYMRDYIENDGEIRQVDFVYVRDDAWHQEQ